MDDIENIYETAKKNRLFDGVGRDDFKKIIGCLGANTRKYKKDGVVLLSGGAAGFVGLILSGGVRIVKEDAGGDAAILTGLAAPETFGEVFACAGIESSPVTVVASEESEILFFDYKKIAWACPAACAFHSKLIENMLKLIAQKNLALNQKIEILSKRTTREKLLAFFGAYGGGAGKFAVPYNREEMARYLCVDRSAMSNELCKMRDCGMLRFNKNVFEVL